MLYNNVGAYGIQRASYDYYIYNQPDVILKVATFWLIRKSNTLENNLVQDAATQACLGDV